MTSEEMFDEGLGLFTALREIYERARSVRSRHELDAFLADMAAMIAGGLGWQRVLVSLHRRAYDDFRVISALEGGEHDGEALGASQTWADWLPRIDARLERHGAHVHETGEVVVAMRGADGDVNGFVEVSGLADGRRPADIELEALVVVANAAGAAIEQMRIAQRADEHRRALEHLLEVSAGLARTRSSEALLEAVCEGIRVALGFQRVAILLGGPEAERLTPVAAVGWTLDEPALQHVDPVSLPSLLSPEFEDHGCYLLARDEAERRTGVESGYPSELNGAGPWAWNRHWLLAPLYDREGAVVGWIWPDDPRDRLLPDSHRLQALRLFADQAEAALAASRSYQETLHAAEHDGLTGLPNRRALLDRLSFALARAQAGGQHVAVLFVDLDRFKAINDTYGHQSGDQVLRTIAARLDAQSRPGDTVARLGGDEFVVVCQDVSAADDALDVAHRLLAAIAEPIPIGADTIAITACIGVALPAEGSDGARSLLRDADVAMYRAKQAGRDTVQLADVVLRAGATARARMERALYGALDRDEIELHWQPIVDLADGRVVRAEGLLRWTHPSLGRVPPSEFIPLAEEAGAILQLGGWVIDRACAQAADWGSRFGDSAPTVAVNLSPRQLRSPSLVEDIEAAMSRHGVGSGALAVEITEGVLLDAGPATMQALGGLRSLGIAIALDDFGTGYSSLSSLERFRIDGLKIDRSFVSGPDRNRRAGAVVEAVLQMARALGLHATAEGVETIEQREWLRSLGCDDAQGYLFGRPTKAAGVEALFGRPGIGWSDEAASADAEALAAQPADVVAQADRE